MRTKFVQQIEQERAAREEVRKEALRLLAARRGSFALALEELCRSMDNTRQSLEKLTHAYNAKQESR